MKIRLKIFLSFGFLFLMIILLGAVGSYYVNQLGKDAAEILKENNRSLIYTENINANLDQVLKSVSFEGNSIDPKHLKAIENNLALQKENITEIGEKALTLELESAINSILSSLPNGDREKILLSIFQAKEFSNKIYDLNQEKILIRNAAVTRTASEVYLYITSISFGAFILGFFFTIGMPSYLTKPIKKFNEAIKKVAAGNYHTKIEVSTKDEFGQLANSFNIMSAKLEEFENSSYSKILSEKKRLDAIINQMDEGILGLDENKNIIFSNKRMLALLGLGADKIKGKYAPDAAVSNALLNNLVGPIMDKKLKYEEENSPIKITDKNSEKLFTKQYFDIKTSSKENSEEALIGHIVLLHDITHFAAKDKAKTKFIATLSHELKTPVAAIEMGTELLKNQKTGQLNTEQHTWVETIENNNLRIRKIINEILELAQIESGSIEIRKEKIEINHILAIAVEAVEPFLKKKDLKVEIEECPERTFIEADGQKLSWIMNNFLTNAIRYAPKSSVITIRATCSSRSVRIAVKDQGKGMNSEQKKNIFKPFFKGQKNNAGGTGLGLVISKEFTEAMGGKIGVTSKTEFGTEFWVQFKLLRQDEK